MVDDDFTLGREFGVLLPKDIPNSVIGLVVVMCIIWRFGLELLTFLDIFMGEVGNKLGLVVAL